MAEPLLVPAPAEPPAPREGVVVEPPAPLEPLALVEPLADAPPDDASPVALPEEPTPAEPAPSSRRQRSFSGPAAMASQRALPLALEPVAALPLAPGEVVLPLMPGEVVLPLTLGCGRLELPLAPVFDCVVVLPAVPEAPVEPLTLPEPEVCAKAVSEKAMSAAVPRVFNIECLLEGGGKENT
ncbi:MAG: hypothetical protein ACT4P4_25840 [Betaproteobacteria bacterium]